LSVNNQKHPNQQRTVAEQLEKQQQLRKIHRARSRLMVCFYTLPLYIIALVLLLNDGRSVTTFMFVYMALYAVFAVDMVTKKCPGCSGQYFVKSFFLNFFTRKCVHCGLPSRDHQSSSSADGEEKF